MFCCLGKMNLLQNEFLGRALNAEFVPKGDFIDLTWSVTLGDLF